MKVLAGLVVIMFAALATRLWFLQVLAAPQFRQAAALNQIRIVPIAPVRGQVLDRSGQVLVGNSPSIAVTVNREDAGFQAHQQVVLDRLSRLLRVSTKTLTARVNSLQYLPYQPVPVAEDVPKSVVFSIAEHPGLYPGVGYQLLPVPSYPQGDLAAQVLGTVGQGLPGQITGTSGVEAIYNKWLRGVAGKRALQVDAQGNILNRNFRVIPAKPGDNVVLSIDGQIQKVAQQALVKGIMTARGTVDPARGIHIPATAGAVVVMNPRNGQVLADASYPSYNPEVFVHGFRSQAQYRREFLAPQANQPLLNRAIQAVSPPGSTFKPFIAAAGLHQGVVSETGSYNCPATYVAPHDTSHTVLHNWLPVNSGYISLPTALAMSCDTVFYQFGYDFYQQFVHSHGANVLQGLLSRMGFGRRTGIDLPGEEAGVIPTPSWKKALFKQNPSVYGKYWQWLPGDDIEMAVGQGFVEVTPMQLAVAYSALANGGTIWQPHVAWKVETPSGKLVKTIAPKRVGRLPITAQEARYLVGALTGVTASSNGTAADVFKGFPLSTVPVAAKTGTADTYGNQEPNSWFAAMAPANNPKYVVVCYVQGGGYGDQTSAPIVRQIFDRIFGVGSSPLQLGTNTST